MSPKKPAGAPSLRERFAELHKERKKLLGVIKTQRKRYGYIRAVGLKPLIATLPAELADGDVYKYKGYDYKPFKKAMAELRKEKSIPKSNDKEVYKKAKILIRIISDMEDCDNQYLEAVQMSDMIDEQLELLIEQIP